MWPWGHLAVGYLSYSVYSHLRYHVPPTGWAVVLLAVGTQLPDAIDKPMAYTFGVLPEGRALAHSLVFAVPLCFGVAYLAWLDGTIPEGVAFAVGYLSHLVADGWRAILVGDWAQVTYLVWPMLPLPDYEAASFAHHARDLVEALRRFRPDTLGTGEFPWWLGIEVALGLLMIGLWILDGAPGVRPTSYHRASDDPSEA